MWLKYGGGLINLNSVREFKVSKPSFGEEKWTIRAKFAEKESRVVFAGSEDDCKEYARKLLEATKSRGELLDL